MKSEYTKGEWEVRKGELNTKEIFITCDKADIAKVFQQLPNAEANAHLIAQAPKLYEACIEVRDNAILQEQESGYYLLRLSYASWKGICQAIASVEGK